MRLTASLSAKIVLLLALALGVLAARAWLPLERAQAFVRQTGYPFVALAGAIFAFQAGRHLLQRWRLGEFRLGRWGLFVCVAGALGLQVHEPHRYKVLFDEHNMVAQAWNMHHHRSPLVPEVAHFVDDHLVVRNERIDKRPLFFPFVLSVVHDLTGYRPANVFYLNAAIAAALVALAFLLGARYGGFALGAALAAAVAFNPLVAQNATGAAQELLNILLIAVCAVAACQYLRHGGLPALNFLVAASLVLAQVRYESILYVGAAASVVALRGWRAGRLELSWFAALAPVFLLVPLLTQKVFLSSPSLMETRSDYFGLGFFPDNLFRAAGYLLSWEPDWTNNLVFSIAGLLALGLLVMLYVRYAGRTVLSRSDDAVFAVFGLTIAATSSAGWLMFWGHWNDPVAARFSLPLQLLFVIALARVAQELGRGRPVPGWAAGGFAAALLAAALPVVVPARATYSLVTGRVHESIVAFLEGRPRDRTFVVYDSAGGLIVEGWASMPTAFFNQRKWQAAECLRRRIYDDIIVIQTFEVDLATGRERPYVQAAPLDPAYQVEPLGERRLRAGYVLRFGRLTAVQGPEATPPDDYLAARPPFRDEQSLADQLYRALP